MRPAARRDRINLSRAAPAPLRWQLDQPVARQLLERGINRTVAHPVKEPDRILEPLLQVVTSRLRLHQKSENRKLDVTPRWRLAELEHRHGRKKRRRQPIATRPVQRRIQRHLMHTYRAN